MTESLLEAIGVVPTANAIFPETVFGLPTDAGNVDERLLQHATHSAHLLYNIYEMHYIYDKHIMHGL